MILLTGASGNIGKELSKLLAQSGIKARAMCRTEEELAPFVAASLEAAIGDFNDLQSMNAVMQGCERMFLLTAAVPQQAQQYKNAIDAAMKAGIRYIVKLSTGDANLDSQIAWAKASAESDHYLRSNDVDWTLLRPTGFMMNMLELKATIAKGFIPNPTGNGKVSWIDHRDIALVAKQVLMEDSHKRATYYLTGPEALSTDDIARKMEIILGKEVKSIPTTMEEMRKNLEDAKLDAWHIDSFIAQYQMVKDGWCVDVTEDVQRITGVKPRNFDEFITECKNDFMQS